MNELLLYDKRVFIYRNGREVHENRIPSVPILPALDSTLTATPRKGLFVCRKPAATPHKRLLRFQTTFIDLDKEAFRFQNTSRGRRETPSALQNTSFDPDKPVFDLENPFPDLDKRVSGLRNASIDPGEAFSTLRRCLARVFKAFFNSCSPFVEIGRPVSFFRLSIAGVHGENIRLQEPVMAGVT
mgnify:FL=1